MDFDRFNFFISNVILRTFYAMYIITKVYLITDGPFKIFQGFDIVPSSDPVGKFSA